MAKPASTYFTLAPRDLDTSDLDALENTCYRLWSTYQRCGDTIWVRTNLDDTAGGQSWKVIAIRVDGVWYIKRGKGLLGQGGKLLTRYLIQTRAKVRSEVTPPEGKVRRYKATAKVYSLPSILNGYKAIVSRDRQADERRSKVKAIDFAAAMAARKAGN